MTEAIRDPAILRLVGEAPWPALWLLHSHEQEYLYRVQISSTAVAQVINSLIDHRIELFIRDFADLRGSPA